ncbi:hypothetical protein C666_02310 [Thauera linaloolentis 47Lol = DSM 12138]|uniref:Uncharacterized protein n=1 Tax=Thauera linaloolentis (strain DSM 12138 / JCM 21573 / CCUG 41526 / CIP 105981 / IAM 15112 / NBRC 102519 / 47Lol) TaxID=1123367 RepID=N6YFG8_THAL4|nr:hypothetical protein C666_02310 [Thauera linaloolentis 47Lol = DSM 12138]
MFLLAAACFGAVYALFVGCLLSLGICLSFIVRPLLRGIFWLWGKITRADVRPGYELAGFNWFALPFALFAVLLVLDLGREDVTLYWGLPLLSVGLYLFYSAARDAGVRFRHGERLLASAIAMPEKDVFRRSGEVNKYKNVQLMGIAVVALLPLFLSGAFGYLLEGAMRMAQVRIEAPAIYVKAPYATLLPEALASRHPRVPEGYTAYIGTTVLFKGFGNMTVVAFPDANGTRQLAIPNEQIIVERQSGG